MQLAAPPSPAKSTRMARIPLEDNFNDVINKAQRGLKISDADLAQRAEVAPADLAAVKGGAPLDPVIRRVARQLKLSPDALEALTHKRWYPQLPNFPKSFAMFNTPHEDMTVNSYLIWDARDRVAAAFDTGANSEGMLDLIHAERLTVRYIFITHTHPDHIADLARLVARPRPRSGPANWSPSTIPGPRRLRKTPTSTSARSPSRPSTLSVTRRA